MFSNKLFKVSPIPTFLWEAIEKLQKLAPLVLGIDDDPEFSFLIRENIFLAWLAAYESRTHVIILLSVLLSSH